MITLASILIALSLVDWLAGPQRNDASRARLLMVLIPLATAAALLNYLASQSWVVALLTLFTVCLGSTLWAGLRNTPDAAHGWWALAALAATLAVGAFVIPALAPEDAVRNSPMLIHSAAYLDTLPWQGLAGVDPAIILLVLGTLLFLGSTANAIVKTVMTQMRSIDYDASEEQLKGGRYIGPLERWLIFGLALAGQPTAAALVISAKSIIRFPELQSKAGRSAGTAISANESTPSQVQKIDELTEYFLIGSLLSWLLALVAALPIVATGELR